MVEVTIRVEAETVEQAMQELSNIKVGGCTCHHTYTGAQCSEPTEGDTESCDNATQDAPVGFPPLPEEPAEDTTAPAATEPEITGTTEAYNPTEKEIEDMRVATRAALANARSKGVNLAELLQKHGAEKFGDLHWSQYGTVLEAAQTAVEALEGN